MFGTRDSFNMTNTDWVKKWIAQLPETTKFYQNLLKMQFQARNQSLNNSITTEKVLKDIM